MGVLLVALLFVTTCSLALYRPHYGIIGYFGWTLLKPEYLWQWALPADAGLQKYLALATIAGFIIHRFPGHTIRGRQLVACVLLIVYLLLSYISSFQSADPPQTAFFMDVIWKIILMTLLAVRLLDTREKLILMMWVAVLAQGFNAFEINMQYFRDGYSLALNYGWGFNDSNTYSIVTVPIMAFSAFLALNSAKMWQKSIAAVIFIMQLHEIFLLESRGCMLGGLLLCGVVWWYSPKTISLQTGAVAAVIIGAILAGPPIIAEFSSIFSETDELDASAASRFDIWVAGWEITKDYPWLGLGPWGAETTVPEYYPGGLDVPRKALHNLFLEVSTGSGLPATVAYLGFFFLPVLAIRRRIASKRFRADRTLHGIMVAVLAGISGYWLSSVFSSGILLESGYLCAAIGIASLAIADREQRAEAKVEDAALDRVSGAGRSAPDVVPVSREGAAEYYRDMHRSS